MKYWLLSTVLCLVFFSKSQTIYIYDLENNTLDSIVATPADTNLTFAHTNYYRGAYSPNIANLSATFPTTNTFPGAEFSLKRKVGLDYLVEDFPIRTSTRLFGVEDGETSGRCSGAMISRKHVLTAAHCQINLGTNDLALDTILVCPAYEHGLEHPVFGCVEVSKVYFIKDWSLNGEDIAVLELKEWVGYETGWLGIGFEEDSTIIANRMHYKFSYPSIYEPIIDSTVYNGDTLYYNYGRVNYITPTQLGVQGGSGIPGESGSHLIHIENDQEYTVYGALNLSNLLAHSRISNWIYHTFSSIISADLNVEEPSEDLSGLVYPNPANDLISIEGFNSFTVNRIENTMGQEISSWRQEGKQINIETLTPGIYFVQVETEYGIRSLRFVKQ